MVLIYTVVNIPYSSMMGVVSPDPSVRTKFSQMRFIMAFMGGLIVQATTLPMVAHFGASAQGVVMAELRDQTIVVTEQENGSSRLEVSAISPDYAKPGFVQKLGIQFGLINEADLGRVTKKKTIYVNTPEFGPPPYTWLWPHSQAPVADHFELNGWMKDFLNQELKIQP